MRTVKAVCHSTINLGRQGENLATEVEFDVSTWLGLFGEGTLEAVIRSWISIYLSGNPGNVSRKFFVDRCL